MNANSNHRHSIPGAEDIHRTELPNGIVILCRSNFTSSSVVISGYIATGSEFDPPENWGWRISPRAA